MLTFPEELPSAGSLAGLGTGELIISFGSSSGISGKTIGMSSIGKVPTGSSGSGSAGCNTSVSGGFGGQDVQY